MISKLTWDTNQRAQGSSPCAASCRTTKTLTSFNFFSAGIRLKVGWSWAELELFGGMIRELRLVLNFTSGALLSTKVTRSFRQLEGSCDQNKSRCEGYASAVLQEDRSDGWRPEGTPLARPSISLFSCIYW